MGPCPAVAHRAPVRPSAPASAARLAPVSFADVRGQEHVKRAIAVAVVGGHNIPISGPSGAQESLVLVTEEGRKSPFLADIGRVCKLTSVPWEELAPVPRLGDRRVEVRVRDAYAVKEHLKRRRYSWNAQDKYWYRSEPAAGFALDKLCEEPWARPGIRIEVYDDGGGLTGRTVC